MEMLNVMDIEKTMKWRREETMDELKEWRCTQGHVMGQVRRNGSGVRQLLLYRESVDMDAQVLLSPDVMAIVEGYAAEVTCSVCGCVRTWVPGQEAMDRLVAMVLRSRGSQG